ERIPGPARLKTQLLSTMLNGSRLTPRTLPLRRLLAIAAASDAAHRGVPRPRRVFDLIIAERPGFRSWWADGVPVSGV
ncbi:MAG: hypothetical protein ACK5CE_08605, partial [Actinomycetes bacterium]